MGAMFKPLLALTALLASAAMAQPISMDPKLVREGLVKWADENVEAVIQPRCEGVKSILRNGPSLGYPPGWGADLCGHMLPSLFAGYRMLDSITVSPTLPIARVHMTEMRTGKLTEAKLHASTREWFYDGMIEGTCKSLQPLVGHGAVVEFWIHYEGGQTPVRFILNADECSRPRS